MMVINARGMALRRVAAYSAVGLKYGQVVIEHVERPQYQPLLSELASEIESFDVGSVEICIDLPTFGADTALAQ